ncbi:MAG: branched-chain amino acid ABC transporter permease [Deltaproteobacteria bacterium]|nr:branched-chain amino acid ABC transporter permease [Deltaproteobacteria bacterium]
MKERVKWVWFCGAVIFFLILPWVAQALFGSTYITELLVQSMYFGIVALSLNLLLGYLGLPSLGHAAYMGIGAYTVAICIDKFQMGCLPASMIAMLVAASAAAIFGLFALRAREVYFLMITLALGMLVWGLAYRWVSLTSGDNGISGLMRPQIGPWSLDDINSYYYFVFIIFCICFLIIYRIKTSPFGHALVGIKESESRMRTLGYNCWLHKYICFVIAGFFSGVAGILYIFYNLFISPSILELPVNLESLLMVSLGGPGTVAGPILGAIMIVFLKEFVSIYTERWLIILGSMYIIVIIYAPNGLMEVVRIGKKFFTDRSFFKRKS